ncbi:hypothetical protein PISL3812_08411 [Talaromyces islandicus]|uniref:Uncharacterized protein n=1 Tax=Talaromyces islandicus TaxID=28573 RepID=A0A0U1M6V6_TALIS|nr:hypothetical protein PISL3812_08411 [Talaromyces islandicus]
MYSSTIKAVLLGLLATTALAAPTQHVTHEIAEKRAEINEDMYIVLDTPEKREDAYIVLDTPEKREDAYIVLDTPEKREDAYIVLDTPEKREN